MEILFAGKQGSICLDARGCARSGTPAMFTGVQIHAMMDT
jgi:hypothetical protein